MHTALVLLCLMGESGLFMFIAIFLLIVKKQNKHLQKPSNPWESSRYSITTTLLMGRTTPVSGHGRHFCLNNTHVTFHDCILHQCDAVMLTKIGPQTDRQTYNHLAKCYKTVSLVSPATKHVSRTTLCHYDTHTQTHRVKTWPVDAVVAGNQNIHMTIVN